MSSVGSLSSDSCLFLTFKPNKNNVMVTGYFASYIRGGGNSLWIYLLQVDKFAQSCLLDFYQERSLLGSLFRASVC